MSNMVRREQIDAGTAEVGKKSKVLWLGLIFVAVTVLLAVVVVFLNVRSKASDLEAALKSQETTVATGRVQSMDLWLGDLEQQGDRIVNSDIFRLFASDISLIQGDVSVLFASPETVVPSERGQVQDLASQLPMMRNMLREFTAYAGFISSRVINARGETYISSETGVPKLDSLQAGRVRQVLQNGRAVFSPVYQTSNGLVIDMFMPIFPPQVDDSSMKPISVLMLSKIVTARLSDFLVSSPLVDKNMRAFIIQRNKDVFQAIDPSKPSDSLIALTPDFMPADVENLPFEVRAGVNGNKVYSLAVKVPNIEWWLLQEVDYDLARAELNSYTKTAIGIGILASLVVILVVSALWWRLVGREQKEIAHKVTGLLTYIEEQKLLLDGINEAIPDLICLTSDKGVVEYANAAFAEAVGRRQEEVLGLDMQALFGFDTAKRLTAPDYQVLMGGEPVVINETVFLQSRKHCFQISKSPLRETAGQKVKGIVSVYRDVTALMEAQERSHRVVQQTIDALVYTIEETDLYLGGRSRFMSALGGMLGEALNLPNSNVQTIEVAGILSQIGKMFIPKEILHKPGAYTEEEKKIMEEHVEHSRKVLRNIEFELPVVDAIYEMNERLDGSGYPRHLTEEEIGMPAKVLAVVNAFTALLRPRSYRSALSAQESLASLRKQGNAYDQRVVDALEELLKTPAGERLLAGFKDS